MTIHEDTNPGRWFDDGTREPIDISRALRRERTRHQTVAYRLVSITPEDPPRRRAWIRAAIDVATIVLGVIALGFACVYLLGMDR